MKMARAEIGPVKICSSSDFWHVACVYKTKKGICAGQWANNLDHPGKLLVPKMQ
jgi:hypothetical protein